MMFLFLNPLSPLVTSLVSNSKTCEKLVSNVNKIAKYINWKPKHDNLRNIIESSINWEKKIYEKNF